MFQNTALKRMLGLVPILLLGGSFAMGQVRPAAISNSGSGLTGFVSFGGQRTHVINYTYNALGIDGGLFVQKSPLFGLEVRGGSYPFYARYSQTPVTGGYRVEVGSPRLQQFMVSGYFGGGMSLAVDAGAHYKPLPAQWSPCWQASQALIVNMGPMKWKVYEGTLTET